MPTIGALLGLTSKGPLWLPDKKSTVEKLPITFSILITLVLVADSKTVHLAFVLSCVINSPATTLVGLFKLRVVTVFFNLFQ